MREGGGLGSVREGDSIVMGRGWVESVRDGDRVGDIDGGVGEAGMLRDGDGWMG